MSDNVNIIVQDTINEIVVNSAVIVETIDINVQVAVDEVTIITNPNEYIINVNRIIGEQVQSDWNETDNQAPDYIKNKPIIPSIEGLATVIYVDQQDALKVDKVVGKGLSTNDFTDTLKTKLDGIQDGAEVNVNADWNATSGDAQILNKPTIPAAVTKTSDLINDGENGINPFITLEDIPVSGLTSVGLTMPVAFNVANSPLTSDGTIAVSAAGTSSQYIRGDGQLATLPSGGGGGSSVNYYLNGSIAASVATYKQLSNTDIIGGGTDFTLTGNGLITQFLTDVGNPNRIEIPGGAWNFEMWFSMSSSGGTPKFYVELLKYNGTTFTTIANSSAVPETINGGTVIDLYLTSLAVPTTTLLSTDRLAIRVYIVGNSGGRTATLHTEDNHLCEILTTFSGGVTSLNGLTANTQYLAVGTTGTDFNISSVSETHTFNLPTASATNRGALSSTDWTAFNGKFNLPSLTSGSVLFSNGTTIAQDNAQLFWDDTNNRLGIGTTNFPGSIKLAVSGQIGGSTYSATYLDLTGAIAELRGNSGIGYYSSAGSHIFYGASSVERMRITSAGNTLINTTVDQGGKLQIKAGGALSTDIALRVRNSADSADLMTVNGLGNVGIGTAAPTQKLDVIGNIGMTGQFEVPDGVVFSNYTSGSLASIRTKGIDIGLSSAIANYGVIETSTTYGISLNINGATKVKVDGTTGNVGIGTTAPVASAKVQIDSTTQGFLPPRMTNAQRIAIATPAVGLCVYCTDVVEGLYINKSTGWTYIG